MCIYMYNWLNDVAQYKIKLPVYNSPLFAHAVTFSINILYIYIYIYIYILHVHIHEQSHI